MATLPLIYVLILVVLSTIAAYATYFRHQQTAEEAVLKADVEGETTKRIPEQLEYFSNYGSSTYSPPTANEDVPATPWSSNFWTVPSTPLTTFFQRDEGSDFLPGSPSWKPRQQSTSMMESIEAVVDKVSGKVAKMLKDENDGGEGLPNFRDDQCLAAEKLIGITVNRVGEAYEQMPRRRRQ